MQSSVLKRLLKVLQIRLSTPIRLNLSPPPRQRADPLPEATLVPGAFFFFGVFIELKLRDVAHLGYPKQAILDTITQAVRWGAPLEFAYPDPLKPRVPWIDDPNLGIAHRAITRVEDVLGAEGMIGGKRYRFERVLDLGQNQVVYGLYNPETRTRTAYGFDRKVFDGTVS